MISKIHHNEDSSILKIATLYNQGDLTNTIRESEKFLSLNYHNPVIWNILGAAYFGKAEHEQAIKAYEQAIKIKTDYAEAYNNLGVTFEAQGKSKEALSLFDQALSINANYAEAHLNKGNSLQKEGKLKESLISFNRALSIKPNYAEALNNMGAVLQSQGKLEDSILAYNKALRIKPNYWEAYFNIGRVRNEQGYLSKAIKAYTKAISLKHDCAEAHRDLSLIKKFTERDPQIQLLEKLIANPITHEFEKCQYFYALGKAYEDLGYFESAFNQYYLGGKLRKKQLSYEIKDDELLFKKIKKQSFNIYKYEPLEEVSSTDFTPIFIVGMPRSGTTLVEQIISCHSQVYGAGELNLLRKYVSDIALGKIKPDKNCLELARNSYMHDLKKLNSSSDFITDKMPLNFIFIGMIFSILPNAKIIHVQRDPSATCWSNFRHYFPANSLGFSYELTDLVSYYKLYEDIMSHWETMYSDRIYQLNYDQLTGDQVGETEKLLEYLGMNWQRACLFPQKNKRIVKTASKHQVAKKIYTGSSQSWRKFKGPLNGAFDSLS